MPVKLYCDICGAEIPEVSEGEGWDTGLLQFGYGIWQEPQTMFYNLDCICKRCTTAIKKAIDDRIKQLQGEKP